MGITIGNTSITFNDATTQSTAAMSSLGYGQTWQNVKASRALNTTYYNTTGRTITLLVTMGQISQSAANFKVNGLLIVPVFSTPGLTSNLPLTVIVSAGDSYAMAGGNSIVNWFELR